MAKRIFGYTVLAVIAIVVAAIVAVAALGLWFLAVVVIVLPAAFKPTPKLDRFKPTDEDLHAWIEGRRG
jgi:O-antigen ligase